MLKVVTQQAIKGRFLLWKFDVVEVKIGVELRLCFIIADSGTWLQSKVLQGSHLLADSLSLLLRPTF